MMSYNPKGFEFSLEYDFVLLFSAFVTCNVSKD